MDVEHGEFKPLLVVKDEGRIEKNQSSELEFSTSTNSYYKSIISLIGLITLVVVAIFSNSASNVDNNRSENIHLTIASPSGSYRACKGVLQGDRNKVQVPVRPGCIYLLSDSLKVSEDSQMVMICGCQAKQKVLLDQTSLVSLGLVDNNWNPLIRAVATGESADVILHRGKSFDGAGYKVQKHKQVSLEGLNNNGQPLDQHVRSMTMWTSVSACSEQVSKILLSFCLFFFL